MRICFMDPGPPSMTSISRLSIQPRTEAALDELLGSFPTPPAGGFDLVLLFATPPHAATLGRLAAEIQQRGLASHVLGCTAESIIGNDQEIEEEPAVSLLALAQIGPVELFSLHTETEYETASGTPTSPLPAPRAGSTVLLFADPFTFPAERYLQCWPGVLLIGGMASASPRPGGNRLILDRHVFQQGAVAAVIQPGKLRTVVSQGCRPIGRPFLITRADRNLILELGRRPAVEVLQELAQELPPEDLALARQGLHVGRVMNEYQERFEHGDFLVRNVVGLDEQGAIAVTDLVRVGQTVQFHVRDASTADEDLKSLLARDRAQHPLAPADAALIVTCNGRGSRLFQEPHHDVRAVRSILGPIPAAGFFAMGEIGPVAGRNYIHGFTASIALFTPGNAPAHAE
jgi:small ligand-binding sensory domain FIST